MGLTIFARVSRGIAAAASVTVAARSVAPDIFSRVYVNVTPCELMRVSVSSLARDPLMRMTMRVGSISARTATT